MKNQSYLLNLCTITLHPYREPKIADMQSPNVTYGVNVGPIIPCISVKLGPKKDSLNNNTPAIIINK